MSPIQTLSPSCRKLLPAAILSALGAVSPLAAHATALSLASYDVSNATVGPPPIAPGTGTLATNNFTDPLDVLFFGAPGGVNVGIHTFGRPDGSLFGSRSSAELNGTGRAYRVDGDFTLDLANITGNSLGFNIIPGQVRAQGAPSGGLGLQAGDYLQSELNLSIMARDGISTDPGDFVEVFGTTAIARVDGTGAFVEWTGDDLGFGCAMGPTSTAGGSLAACSFSGGAQIATLLGFATHDITYTLTTIASGSVSLSAGSCGFGDQSGGDGGPFEDGSGFNQAAAFGGGGACRSVAQIGDPLVFVPAPATLGLAALGLAAAARSRRKKVIETA